MEPKNEQDNTRMNLTTRTKVIIAYDGTKYSGWQVQPNGISIQSLLQQALTTALRTPISVAGAGRTDSGVHALGQVAHFDGRLNIDIGKLSHSLNGILPLDIRVRGIEEVSPTFHARYSALGKIYRYHLHTGKVLNPFTRLYSYHLPYPIDEEALKKATQHFIGKNDFSSFSNEAHLGSAARNPVRTIKRLEVLKQGEEIVLEFEGDGFLYKMVRNIVGTLLEVARGKMSVDDIPTLFEAKDRTKAPATAPPYGLFLIEVIYSDNNALTTY